MKSKEFFARLMESVNRKPFAYLSKGRSASVILFLAATASLSANPTGGVVVSGSATISGLGTPNVTVTQTSNTLVIDWKAFSISKDEVTTFIQPSATSTVLNRVTGGGISKIDGAHNATGHAYVVNSNGIDIGSGAAVKAAGFIASTLDLSNSDFLASKLHFTGASANGVRNLGSVTAGDIYLIGSTVDNDAYLAAATGTVGMAAGHSVLIKPSGSQHVLVDPSSSAKPDSSATAVINNGKITAVATELRAANGNRYALAINNSGTIRATTVGKKGGNVYLTSDSGTIVNAGTIDASATAPNGTSGQITLKSSGIVVNHGSIIGHGGQGGIGGTVDLSGGSLDFKGGVDLTTPGGKTGNLLLDPQSINIIDNPNANGTISTVGTTTTYMPAPGFIGSELYTETLEAQLAIANVIVDGLENVTVTDTVTWGDTTASTSGKETGNTLTLETTVKGGTIVINNALSGHVSTIPVTMGTQPPKSKLAECTLVINAFDNGFVTTGPNGTIDVDNFTLENGIWQQIVSPLAPSAKDPGYMTALPAFNVSNDFQLQGTSTFERFAGGNGLLPTVRAPNNAPYQIPDIYALQGIGSPSDTLLAGNYILSNNINNDGTNVTGNTINWNGGDGTDGGAGWVPIGEGGKTVEPFTGTFNGNGFYVAGYYLYRPADNLCGLFSEVSGTVKNVGVDAIDSEGLGIGAILVGRLLPAGQVISDVITGGAFGDEPTDPAMPSAGTTANQSDLPSADLGVSEAGGGLVGEIMKGGLVINSDSFVGFTLLSGSGSGGLIGDAGLVGVNYGTITNSFSFASGSTAVSVTTSALAKPTEETDSIALGGLVGTNFGTINGGAASGDDVTAVGAAPNEASILSGVGNFYIGGFVGVNYGTIDGKVIVKVNGKNVAETYQAFTTNDVTGPGEPTNPILAGGNVDGGTGSYYVGGFVGGNYGTITNAYSAPTVTGYTDNFNNPLATGGVVTANGSVNGSGSGVGTGALGNYAVGGFAGGNFGNIIHSGTEDTVVSNGSVTGVGTTTRTVAGKKITAPEVVSFGVPLSLDSMLVGGFVGLNCPNGSNGNISGSFSDTADATVQFTLDPTVPLTPTAAPTGDTFTLSSLAGNNNPLVSSTGLITGGTGYIIVGGFAGGNFNDVSTSYATGNVEVTGTTTQSNSFYTGGFAGVSSNAIANAYAQGDVISETTTGTPQDETGVVGGFAAEIYGGSLADVYSIGSVAGGTTRGGLVGVEMNGRALGSFWDTLNNGTLFGYSAVGTSEPDTSMMTTNLTYQTSIYGMARWNFKTIWTAPGTAGYPTLLNVP